MCLILAPPALSRGPVLLRPTLHGCIPLEHRSQKVAMTRAAGAWSDTDEPFAQQLRGSETAGLPKKPCGISSLSQNPESEKSLDCLSCLLCHAAGWDVLISSCCCWWKDGARERAREGKREGCVAEIDGCVSACGINPPSLTLPVFYFFICFVFHPSSQPILYLLLACPSLPPSLPPSLALCDPRDLPGRWRRGFWTWKMRPWWRWLSWRSSSCRKTRTWQS